MSTTAPIDDPTVLTRIVKTLIGPTWAEKIEVLGTGANDGTPYVDIGARTDIACYQAMISIADHALNPIESWELGWRDRGRDGAQPRYTFRILAPRAEAREPDEFAI